MKWIYLMENSDSVKALYRWQGRNQTSGASSCLLRLSIRTQAEGFCFSETCDRFETRWWWWCAGSEGRVGEGGRGVKHLYEKTGRQTREKNDKKKRSRSPQENIEAWTFTKNSETHRWYDADVCTTAVLRTHEGQNGTYRSAPLRIHRHQKLTRVQTDVRSVICFVNVCSCEKLFVLSLSVCVCLKFISD